MANVSHTSAFKAQTDFAPEAKMKVGNDIWSAETAGSRFYAEVLSQNPALSKKSSISPQTGPAVYCKQVQGHFNGCTRLASWKSMA